MLKRDFTKSNKEYFKKNKITLISVAIFLIVGILVFAIFGMNGNFEVNGYNEFSITVSEKATEKFGTYQQEIGKIVDSYNGSFDNVSIYGEGDNTQFVVRYLKDINGADQIEVNKLIAEKIGVNVANVSEHTHVNSIVKNTDYVYTAVAILLIVVIASILAYVRYNGASAMAIILASLLGTLGFISIGAILRLSVGMNYFAMLILLNMLIVYIAIDLFESMHKSNWLMADDFDNAMQSALKSSKYRMGAISIGLMIIGLLLVLFTSSTIKYAALNLLFMAVALMAVGLYVIPFVWNVFITHCRKREYKIKTTIVEPKKED